MRTANILIAGALLVVALPAVGAQEDLPTQGKVVDGGCDELENCDPLAANEGRITLSTEDRPVRIVLFGHFQDLLQRAPLNTQPPDPEQEPDLNRRFNVPTIYTEDSSLPCCRFDSNRFQMFSSPGFVEYLADGKWRVHQEPGLAEPARLVPIDGKYMYGYWYMSANAKPSGVSQGPDAGVVPLVGVHMKMNLGRFPSDDPADVIAEGDTGTGLGATDPARCGFPDNGDRCVTMLTTPSGEVYEFKVPMEIKKRVIPSVWDVAVDEKKQGYMVQVFPYQVQNEQVRVMQADWHLRTGWQFPPRIVLDIEKPVVTKSTRVHTFDDYLFFRWSFSSPWGSYDVDPNALEIRVDGPKALGPSDLEFVKLHHCVDHDCHFKPLNATWRYGYVDKPLPPGTYRLSAMTHNLQNTYMLVWEEEFTVGDDGIPQVEHIGRVASAEPLGQAAGSGKSPGLAGFSVLAAIGAVATLVRRRG